MEIEIQLTNRPVAANISSQPRGAAGAWVEFRGIVRGEENGMPISALEYEAYSPMAEMEMRRIVAALAEKSPCLAAKVIHRIGVIPVGETAVYVGVAAKHRAEAFVLLAQFMDRLKEDVPIWKRRSIPKLEAASRTSAAAGGKSPISWGQAIAEIESRCRTLSGMRMPLTEAPRRVLRETVRAMDDSPDYDRSTRDGYAVLLNDESAVFAVVDIIHAADWKPRQLKRGEAVRVATGAALPCENLHVVMQEHADRSGDQIKILQRESSLNLRRRGEDWRAGDAILPAGFQLNAGAAALLASVGCTQPLVSPKPVVLHFTTGDEIIPVSEQPKPGQVRDSNSVLIRALLEEFDCEVKHAHLPEDFECAKEKADRWRSEIESADVVLVSGGASVGDKDFTRSLLEWWGFETVFSQVNIRPGKPLIFGSKGEQIAFGLPGNPLSHFVCFQLFVAAALSQILGAQPKAVLRGSLIEPLEDAPNQRETFWPARWAVIDGHCELTPLRWSSSGDVKCLAETNALIRVPPHSEALPTGTIVEYLPIEP